jgi:hypothetical protein
MKSSPGRLKGEDATCSPQLCRGQEREKPKIAAAIDHNISWSDCFARNFSQRRVK